MMTTRTVAFLAIPWLLSAQDGVSPIIGGLPFDSGIALGLEYRQSRLAGGPLDFRAKAIGSFKKYEFLEAAVMLPRLAGRLLFLEAQARYLNYPEEEFWGLGAQSSRDLRTTFRFEAMEYVATFGIRPRSWLRLGLTGGMLDVNTGPGKDRDRPSIEQRFTPAQVPALEHQPDYRHAGAFLYIDYRDQAADPRRGGSYAFRWTNFHDHDFGRFHFHRYQIDLRQFFPSFRERDTLAMRGLAVLTTKSPGRQVPFFMQPTAGGGADLRGYPQYRFRDENSLVANLEYRWRVREMFHAVMFTDAGGVFSRPGQIGFSGLHGSAGVGGRFKLGESLLFGIDMGWSLEGPRFWFRGAHAF